MLTLPNYVCTYGTAQLLGKTYASSTCACYEFLASRVASYLRMLWLLAIIIVEYMDIVNRVLARHITGNLIVMDGPCLSGHRVKKDEDC